MGHRSFTLGKNEETANNELLEMISRLFSKQWDAMKDVKKVLGKNK